MSLRVSRLLLVPTVCALALFVTDASAQSGSRSGSGSRGPTYRPSRPANRAPVYQPTYQSPPPSNATQGSTTQGSNARSTTKMVALRGFSPVAITAQQQWVRGNPQIQTTYDGMTYYFATAAEQQQFQASPARYIPALGGDCVVCFAKGGSRIAGSVDHAARTPDGRVYLFPGPGEKQEFLNNTAKYVNADVAFGGNCIVCQVKGGKIMPGSPEHTAVYKGQRFLFPTAGEKTEFLSNPSYYAGQVPATAAPSHAGSTTRPAAPPAGSTTRPAAPPAGSGSRSR